MYSGIVTPVVNIRPHPNADRLSLGTAAGHQVVVSKSVEGGTVGVFFPCDGRLSSACLSNNNLYRHPELNNDKEVKSGFFDDNGRVRAQKFRGAISEGFWTELSVLSWTGADLSSMKTGDAVQKVNGHVVCEKYYTPATMRAMTKNGKASKKAPPKESFPTFREHFGVQKLRHVISNIPAGAELYFTEKCHGTSGRTGCLPVKKRTGLISRLLSKFFPPAPKYKHVSGTRRTVLDSERAIDAGFYSGKTFRVDIHKQIESAGLHMGETVYYEVVGFDEKGGRIMGAHGITDKALKKRYGRRMVYSYGCDPSLNPYKVLVYRITYTMLDGAVVEAPWHQVVNRCMSIGLSPVPELASPVIYDGDAEALTDTCERLSRGDSSLDSGHIKEGVVVRAQYPGLDAHYKYKSFHFCELEGIAKNNDEYVDPEEVS